MAAADKVLAVWSWFLEIFNEPIHEQTKPVFQMVCKANRRGVESLIVACLQLPVRFPDFFRIFLRLSGCDVNADGGLGAGGAGGCSDSEYQWSFESLGPSLPAPQRPAQLAQTPDWILPESGETGRPGNRERGQLVLHNLVSRLSWFFFNFFFMCTEHRKCLTFVIACVLFYVYIWKVEKRTRGWAFLAYLGPGHNRP